MLGKVMSALQWTLTAPACTRYVVAQQLRCVSCAGSTCSQTKVMAGDPQKVIQVDPAFY
jgi:3D (Asp-Asp-Asp) domain-containing protein